MMDRVVDTTVRIKFTTNNGDGAPVAPSSAFAVDDFRVYKDGSAAEKTTTNGITVTSPLDSVVGRHLIEIDTSNDTGDAGFWAAGSEYWVEINSAKTVDSQSQSGVEVGRFRLVTGTVVLDSATQTQIDNIETSLTTLGSESTTVERSTADTNAITFSWPVSGATITGTRSLNNGSYGAVVGAIAFLRSETGKHYYTLAYNSADRPAAEGQVRYKFVDGTYTGYVVLRTVNLVTEAQVNAQVLDVLSVDTFAELAAPPAATSSLKDKITWLFMYARNKVTQTALARTLYRDDTTTVAGTSATSDNGTTFTKGEDA